MRGVPGVLEGWRDVGRGGITRAPVPALRAFISAVWVGDRPGAADDGVGFDRERMLGSGATHLVFRLSDHPIRLYDHATDPTGTSMGHAVVGGARATYYLRDTPRRARSVGAILRPGAAELLFGTPAGALAGRHTPLVDLWGRSAAEARERLLEATHPESQLDLLEALLAARLPAVRGLHPAVAHALARFHATDAVGDVVDETGYSHRRFITLFREAVGLPPKLYCRVLRFHDALRLLASQPPPPLADVALAAGYSDQPHLNRDFRELAGVSPGEYRGAAPASPLHLPLSIGSIPSKTSSAARGTMRRERRIP
jgi:AraC-like DNA-binding protein